MPIFRSNRATVLVPPMSADGAKDVIPLEAVYTMTGAEASGDVLEMVCLPAGYVVVDVLVDSEGLATTATSGVGIITGEWLSDAVRTCGSQFMAAKPLQTAGIYRMDVAGSARIAPATTDRALGIALTTVSTPTAGRTVRMNVLARPMVHGS